MQGIATVIILLTALMPMTTAGDRSADGELTKTMHVDEKPAGEMTLFMGGDVMLGRGIDQILPVHNDPVLYERYIRDARDYVRIAEIASGPIPQPASCRYIWGEALDSLQRSGPDVRLINLETSITHGGKPWRDKYIHYRMHPENAACLETAGIDVCSLANNHVLDWGYDGLTDTLATLERIGVDHAGAGLNRDASIEPAVVEIEGKGRVLIFAYALPSSGVPGAWAAREQLPGVNLLQGSMEDSIERIRKEISAHRQAGDTVLVSIHWGGNWGYRIPDDHVEFAHRLIDRAGVDLIHGHSSHHPQGLEVYQGRLIIYGSGDLLNDYEGIGGYEEYRPDLSLMYFADIETQTGMLKRLRMVPMRIRRLSLQRADHDDAVWLQQRLSREGHRFGTRVGLGPDHELLLEWQQPRSIRPD